MSNIATLERLSQCWVNMIKRVSLIEEKLNQTPKPVIERSGNSIQPSQIDIQKLIGTVDTVVNEKMRDALPSFKLLIEPEIATLQSELAKVSQKQSQIEKNNTTSQQQTLDLTQVERLLGENEKRISLEVKKDFLKERTLIETSIMRYIETMLPKLLSEKIDSKLIEVKDQLRDQITEQILSQLPNFKKEGSSDDLDIDISFGANDIGNIDDLGGSAPTKRKYVRKPKPTPETGESVSN